jgi:hypothetical protein
VPVRIDSPSNGKWAGTPSSSWRDHLAAHHLPRHQHLGTQPVGQTIVDKLAFLRKGAYHCCATRTSSPASRTTHPSEICVRQVQLGVLSPPPRVARCRAHAACQNMFVLLFWLTVPVHRQILDWWVERRVGVPPVNGNILSGAAPSRNPAQAVVVGSPGRVTEDLVGGQDLL